MEGRPGIGIEVPAFVENETHEKQMNGIYEKNKNALIGAIDEGTTSARFVVFSASTAKIVAYHQREVVTSYPHPGWVEQDPKEIINAVVECVDETVKKLQVQGIKASDVMAVGITNQRETTVLWDKVTGEPLYNAIIWMDNRTLPTIDSLLESKANKDMNQLSDLTGLPISPYFSATKYRWLIDNVPAVQKAIKEKRCMFGTIDTWLIWNLTGGKDNGIHITDSTNASRTLLMNLQTLQWDPILTDFFDISIDTLPEIRSSSEVYGCMAITLLKDVPIAGCLGDQQAALVGQMCFNKGDTKCTYGTGCFILTNTGPEQVKSSHGLLTTLAYKLGTKAQPIYALEGSVAACGATMTWLKNNMRMVSHVADIEKLAEQVPSTDGVYFVPAFQGLYAPYWKPKARGAILGLTMETDQRHIARAAIEGIGYQVAAIMASIRKDSHMDINVLKIDGGMGKNNLLLQFQADISGIELGRSYSDMVVVGTTGDGCDGLNSGIVFTAKQEMLESTSFGAAIAAGIAEGVNLVDLETIKMNIETFRPGFSDEERKEKMEKWETAVKKSIFE